MRRRTAAVLSILVLVAAGILGFPWNGEAGTVLDDGPSGTADLLTVAEDQGLGASRITSTPLLMRGDPQYDPQKTLLLVPGATRAYTEEEAGFLHRFLDAGGKAIVSEEGGLAATLLTRYGVAFERVPVLHVEGDTPVTFLVDNASHPLRVRLPTALIIADGSPAETIATTPQDSFVDRDNDGRFGRADPAGPFPVAARVDVGDDGGRLIVLGSVDLLRDRSARDPGVLAWRHALFASLLPDGGALVVDDSHRSNGQNLGWLVRATSTSPARWVALAMAVIGASYLAITVGQGITAWRPHEHRPDRYRRRNGVGGSPLGARDPSAADPPRNGWSTRAAQALAAMTVLAVAGLVVRSPTAVVAALTMACILLAAGLQRRPRLEVERNLSSDKSAEGDPVTVRLDLRAKQGMDVEVRDGVPPEDEVRGDTWQRLLLRRSEKATIRYDVIPHVRGPHWFGPLRVRTSDPFGLRFFEAAYGTDATSQVAPRQEPLKSIRLPVRRPEILMGIHPVNRAGEGTEFQALREYQAGDPMRSVNWKASARSKGLMVNQRVLESQTLTTMILDARSVSEAGPAQATPMARSARYALTIASASVQMRDRIRFLAFGEALDEIPPGPSQRFIHGLTERLSRMPASGDMAFKGVAARIVTGLRPGTPVVLFSGLEGDAGFGEGAKTLVGRGASLTVFAFPVATRPVDGDGDPEPDEDEIHARRADNLKAMRDAGATVFDVQKDLPLDALLRFQGGGR